MNTGELENIIKSRRSIRAWQDKDVPEELILKAIEMATYAPNAGNQQNWRFYVILNRSTIGQIADAVQASADNMASWSESARFGESIQGMLKKSSFFRTAPAAIAIAASQYQSPAEQLMAVREDFDPTAMEMREWRNTANSKIQSVSSAAAILLLVLHQMGLGAVWMTGPMQAKGEIERILKIPPGLDLVTFIPVGYPAEKPPLKERKPVQSVCEIIR